jgi:hypothetical protein
MGHPPIRHRLAHNSLTRVGKSVANADQLIHGKLAPAHLVFIRP